MYDRVSVHQKLTNRKKYFFASSCKIRPFFEKLEITNWNLKKNNEIKIQINKFLYEDNNNKNYKEQHLKKVYKENKKD